MSTQRRGAAFFYEGQRVATGIAGVVLLEAPSASGDHGQLGGA